MFKPSYDEVPDDIVDPNVREAAEDAAVLACNDLGLGPVTIHWFRMTDPHLARIEQLVAKLAGRSSTSWTSPLPIFGEARNLHPRDIWVNAELNEREAVITVRHELRHLWQYKHWGIWVTEHEHERTEADARAYETS